MWVTAYCDASWSRRGQGGWAVWVRSGGGRLVRSGACPPYVNDSVSAEMAAVFAALYLAVKTWGPRVKGVLVCSDCQPALIHTAPDYPLAQRRSIRRMQQRIRALILEHGIAVRTRWVQGHRKPTEGTPAYLNHWCDRSARRARRAG